MNKRFKITAVLFVLLFSVQLAFSQRALKNALQGEWIKERITLKDGSPIYDKAVLEASFMLDFRNDSLVVSYQGKNIPSDYTLRDSVLMYRNTSYKIVRLDKPILELYQIVKSEDTEPIRLVFTYKPVYDLATKPDYYLAKNKERVYLNQPDVVEPKFLSSRFTAMDYIYANFKYPEFRKGGFVARFVITKTGKMKGLRLVASSSSKYDDKLIAAIKKTEGKWIPAQYLGENVNCEVEYNFDLGWSGEQYTSNNEELEKATAEEYQSNGKYYFSAKNYRSAIYYFTKAIEKNPYLVDAYYLRAASYIYREDLNSACGDYLQLKHLGQQKAISLYDKYCGAYVPKEVE